MATVSGTLEILSMGHLQLYAVPPHSSEVRFSDNKKNLTFSNKNSFVSMVSLIFPCILRVFSL